MEVPEEAWESSPGPHPGVAGRPRLSQDCPGNGSVGGGGRAVSHAEPEMGCPAPRAPCLLRCGVQLRPALRFPGHAAFSIMIERVPGHGEGAVGTLEGAGEPPRAPLSSGPQLLDPSATDPWRDLGQMPSLPCSRHPPSKGKRQFMPPWHADPKLGTMGSPRAVPRELSLGNAQLP